jgi:hypothetical protein
MTAFSLRALSGPVGLIAIAVASFCSLGCSGDKSNRVSGKVNFNGQPVPAGKIYFTPDASQGNEGPTGYADIKNGVYDTSAAGGQGSVSGPVIVAIEGHDPNTAKSDKDNPDVAVKTLFPRYETELAVSGDTEKDFDVPAEAAKGPPKPKGPAVVTP